jgi:hydrogenase maturation protein HypF
MAENGEDKPTLGIIWDGTGYGSDGTIWGGEFLLGDAFDFERVGSLRSFRLPGGDAAAREPRRSAIGMLYQTFGANAFDMDLPPVADGGLANSVLLGSMLEQGVRSPWTTSAGRLFDGIASLLGLRHVSAFEGDAAMTLEFVADRDEDGAYVLPLRPLSDESLVLDWSELIRELIADRARGTRVEVAAARAHNALVNGIVAVACAVGQPRVALSGGCFQNRWLLEHGARALRDNGFQVLLHKQVPPNDGGVSLGQAVVAAARLRRNG